MLLNAQLNPKFFIVLAVAAMACSCRPDRKPPGSNDTVYVERYVGQYKAYSSTQPGIPLNNDTIRIERANTCETCLVITPFPLRSVADFNYGFLKYTIYASVKAGKLVFPEQYIPMKYVDTGGGGGSSHLDPVMVRISGTGYHSGQNPQNDFRDQITIIIDYSIKYPGQNSFAFQQEYTFFLNLVQ